MLVGLKGGKTCRNDTLCKGGSNFRLRLWTNCYFRKGISACGERAMKYF